MGGIGRGQTEMEKILIAAPTHECKRYALIPYLRAIKFLRHPNSHVLIVDNSPTPTFSEEIRNVCQSISKPFEVIHLADLPQGEDTDALRIALSQEVIRERAIKEEFDFWFSLEVDVICPPETLEYMIGIARQGFDIVRHGYPARQDIKNYIDAMGCAIYSVSLLRGISWIEGEENYVGGDSAFYQWSLERGCKISNIFNVLNIIHLDG